MKLLDDADLKAGIDILSAKAKKDEDVQFCHELKEKWENYLKYRKENPEAITIGISVSDEWMKKFRSTIGKFRIGKQWLSFSDSIADMTLEEILG